jgi:hypothetical protein
LVRRFRFCLNGAGVQGLDEDEHDDIPADEDPYSAALTSDYENGDWPPPAATIALDELPDDLEDIGEQIEHFPCHQMERPYSNGKVEG